MKKLQLLLLFLFVLCGGSCSNASSSEQRKAPPTIENRASGKMTYKGITTKVEQVYAQDTRDLLDEGTEIEEVEVLLAERALSGIEPDEQVPYAVQIRIDKEGPREAIVYVSGVSVDMLDLRFLNDCPKRSGTSKFVGRVIEGSLSLSPGECVLLTIKQKYELAYELSFKAYIQPPDDNKTPVTARTGKPLPVGGGEAGKVATEFFRTLIDSVKLGDTRSSTPADAIEERKKLDEQDEIYAKKMAGFLLAGRKVQEEELMKVAMLGGFDQYEIGNGFINGKRATLSIKAPLDGGRGSVTWIGKINLILEQGQWKVLRVGMKMPPPSAGGEIYW